MNVPSVEQGHPRLIQQNKIVRDDYDDDDDEDEEEEDDDDDHDAD